MKKTDQELVEYAKHWIVGNTSCIGCVFLYKRNLHNLHYSNEDTEVRCALDRNSKLPACEPYDWNTNESDNWPATANGRCVKFQQLQDGEYTCHLDVDGYYYPDGFGLPNDVVEVIEQHSGRKRK